MYIMIALYPLCDGRVMASAFGIKVNFIPQTCDCLFRLLEQLLKQVVDQVLSNWLWTVTRYSGDFCVNYFTKTGKCVAQNVLTIPECISKQQVEPFFLSVYLQYFVLRKQNNSIYQDAYINKMLNGFIW